MEKINISFIQYGGLAYGGAQKQAITLAQLLDKNIFSVRYFWSEPAQDKYSTFVHPTTNLNYLNQLQTAGVEPIEFTVRYRDISHSYHLWQETNFFEIFKKFPTDVVFSVRGGKTEFPFVHLNYPVVEWNIFGSADASQNLVASVAVSPWVQQEYFRNGGRKEISSVCFPGVSPERSQENLRNKVHILPEEVVLGFHQRQDDGIYAEHALRAFAQIRQQTDKKLRFFILGGSKKYQQLAQELDVPIEFLPVIAEYQKVSQFLNSLDIFTHNAGLGESAGLAVMEAMVHGLPVVTKIGANNGHLDVLQSPSLVAASEQEYAKILGDLVANENKRKQVGQENFQRAKNIFSLPTMKKFFEALLQKTYAESCSSKKRQFSVLPVTIYKQFNFYRVLYRFLFISKLLNVALIINRKLKNIFL